MRRISLVAAVTIAFGCLGVSSALAQLGGASSTGSIAGTVTDESAAVLPGVTVTAASTALIQTLTSTTNAEGIYRFPSVPPGEYKLTFELSGFTSLSRSDIRVGLGITVTINQKMGVQALQETVTVTSESPTIDTAATRIQTNYTALQLDSLPNARDMWSLLATTPSVVLNRFDVGGSTAGTQTTYFAYGYSGQNRPLIEGINTTEGTSAAGFYLDYGSFEEVFIGAAANSAEMPNPGVLTQFVGKSGSNQLHANMYYDFETEDMQSTNLEESQLQPNTNIRVDGNRLASYKNLNLGVGGPIARNRAWFHGAYLRQKNEVAQPSSGLFRDGTIFPTLLINYTGKGTYQLSQNNRFIGYLQHGTKKQPFRTDAARATAPIHLTSESSLNQNSPSWVYKGEYNRTIGDSMYFEVRAGQFGYNFGLVNYSTDPRYEDLITQEVTGGGRDWELRRRRNQYTGTLSYFKDGFLGGNHSFKFGGELLHETGDTIWASGYTDQTVHVLRNGVPSEVRLYATPYTSKNGLRTYSGFVTDTYVIKRLSLNLGARYDRYRVFLPAQENATIGATFEANSNIKTFNHLAPRVGATLDLMGDGKTVLKMNVGRYYYNPGVNLADSLNPNTANQYSDYVWNDLNGDRRFQTGETGALVQRFGGVANAFIDPDLENAYTDEVSGWVERELFANFGVRTGYVWKRDENGYQQVNELRPLDAFNVPITVNDIGEDGVAGTGDDSPIQAFNLDTTTRGSRNVTKNIDEYEGTYRTFEIAATRRYVNRWSMSAAFSYTWTDEFAANYVGNTFGTTGTNATFFGVYPSNPNDRTHNDFTNWNFKVHGTFEPKWGLRFTPVLKHQSGAPYGRFTRVALNYSSTQPILVEPIGTRRQDNVTIVDLRAEKQLPLGPRAKVGLFLDLFNLLNANPAVNIQWVSGPTFERATTVLPPRIVKLGVKLDW
jgi:hypothetical protein